jgi:endonuclease G, mitochondrial
MARSKSPLDQLNPKQRMLVIAALVVLAVGIALYRGCQEPPLPPTPGQTLANRNVRFGMPGEAKADPASKDAYLMERPQYVLSYNDSKKIPNWVCWNLNKSDIGTTPRSSFVQDPDLPAGFYRVKHGDYTGFGFDRGHLCPAKDRSDTEENNRAVFYMTNIMPQSGKSNQGAWERFEDYCRRLTNDGSELYIAAGPHGQGGTAEITDPKTKETRQVTLQTIGSAKIWVPAVSWKVVLVLPNKEVMPTQTTRAIAVWVPNDQTVPEDWKPYAVSVATVEERTGYKFFPLVPDDVAAPIKSRTDSGP